MPDNKEKGKRVERSIVNWMKERGVASAARSVQYCGKNGDSDVVAPDDLSLFHIEVKGTKEKKLNKSTLLKWANQLKLDNKFNRVTVLFHVANGEEPIAFIPIHTLIPLSLTLKPELFSIEGALGDSLTPSVIIKKLMLERKIKTLITGIEPIEEIPFLAFEINNDNVFLATDGELFLKEMRYYEKVVKEEHRASLPD